MTASVSGKCGAVVHRNSTASGVARPAIGMAQISSIDMVG
jgi:hypothetical protein